MCIRDRYYIYWLPFECLWEQAKLVFLPLKDWIFHRLTSNLVHALGLPSAYAQLLWQGHSGPPPKIAFSENFKNYFKNWGRFFTKFSAFVGIGHIRMDNFENWGLLQCLGGQGYLSIVPCKLCPYSPCNIGLLHFFPIFVGHPHPHTLQDRGFFILSKSIQKALPAVKIWLAYHTLFGRYWRIYLASSRNGENRP